MNKVRREELKEIVRKMEVVKSVLEDILSDEEYYYNNMPENLQYSLRGRDSEDAIDQIGEAVGSIDDAVNAIYRIV